MTISIEPLNSSPPQNASLLVPFHMRREDTFWTPKADSFSQAAMVSAGAAMVSKNRILAWPSVFIAIFSYVNSKPLRTKESSGGGGLQGLGFAIMSVLSVYVPTFLVLPDVAHATRA